LPDKGLLVEQVPQHSTLGIEDQQIGLLTGQFAHDRPDSFLIGESKFYNTVT
jgi:hypothetical protein